MSSSYHPETIEMNIITGFWQPQWNNRRGVKYEYVSLLKQGSLTYDARRNSRYVTEYKKVLLFMHWSVKCTLYAIYIQSELSILKISVKILFLIGS